MPTESWYCALNKGKGDRKCFQITVRLFACGTFQLDVCIVQVMPRVKSTGAASGSSGDGTSGLWLVKSEPDEFSIEDLQSKPNQTGMWDGMKTIVALHSVACLVAWDADLCCYRSACTVAMPTPTCGVHVLLDWADVHMQA